MHDKHSPIDLHHEEMCFANVIECVRQLEQKVRYGTEKDPKPSILQPSHVILIEHSSILFGMRILFLPGPESYKSYKRFHASLFWLIFFVVNMHIDFIIDKALIEFIRTIVLRICFVKVFIFWSLLHFDGSLIALPFLYHRSNCDILLIHCLINTVLKRGALFIKVFVHL